MDASSLTVTALAGIPTVAAGADLAGIALDGIAAGGIEMRDGDILVFAQKIVSKAEGRRVKLAGVTPSARAVELAKQADKDPRIVELILAETAEVLRCRPGAIIVEDRRGMVMAHAGIDASNVEGDGGEESVLLLPADPDASAARIRDDIHARVGKTIGVIINDSFGRAWRLGTVGTAIGVAGMPGLLDLRGKPDRTGRLLQTSELGVADEAAAAASLMMGQANEGRPIVHMRGFPYPMTDGSAAELVRPRRMDLFR
jgi:coenzyme F420-0:L-glutamate ligase/coenzyme F420-1:gamma-L-glutamate ligase